MGFRDPDVTAAERAVLGGYTGSAAELNVLDGVLATTAELNALDLTALGTGAASEAIVLDTGDDYIWPAAGLLEYKSADITANGLEINSVCDMSGKMLPLTTVDLALTLAAHSNRIVYYNDPDANMTLPAATGTGNKYTVVFSANCTSLTITTAGSDFMLGGCSGVDDDADAAYSWDAIANTNTISASGTATGGKAGDWYEFLDIASALWIVRGFITQSGASEVTPFSNV